MATKLFLILTTLPCLLAAQTSMNLTASPTPSRFGAPVVLTASVTPAAATGQVTFYDGVTIVGTKPLVAGTASISTILLPVGNRKLKAYYAGDASHAAATSNVVTQTVNAAAGGGLASGPAIMGTALYSVVAEADFNGDGKADIVGTAVSQPSSQAVVVLLGDGAGNFHESFRTDAPNSPVAVGDFNSDGIPDLAVAVNATSTSMVILLGNGDGTFRPLAGIPFSGFLYSIAVGDFNSDGKADIVVVNGVGVAILLGRGDGTFQPPVSYAGGPSNNRITFSALVADFNGDGKTDIAADQGILLGNGDGTFQQVLLYPSGLTPSSPVAVGDFNGDGKADLVTSRVEVLLGNGDGTFQTPLDYGGGHSVVAVGDFNGDGRPDLAVTSFQGYILSILYGVGDGTFLPPAFAAMIPTADFTSPALAGDFNGDGITDLAVSSLSGTPYLFLGTSVSVTPTAGSPQSTAITRPFPIPLQVTVKNGATPLGGVTVTFTAPPLSGPSAALSSGTATTDLNGVASVIATANSVAGSYTVTATAQGVSTQFSLTNTVAVISARSGSPTTQSVLVGLPFPKPLQVMATDLSGAPASGVSITFSAPNLGASAFLSASTVVTDASGIASVTALANNIPGSYSVIATGGIVFSLTNLGTAVPVALTTSANPSNFGAPVTLTATVSRPNAAGHVTFCDGGTLLGIKTASAGVASFSTVLLSAGTHRLTAYYRDEVNAIIGTSNAVTQTVKAAAGGAFISTNPLGLTPAGSPIVTGDFNRDGKVDFAFLYAGGVAAILGNGDGTFRVAGSHVFSGGADFLVASDFDGDGNTDLAVGNASGTISILLGSGDGTFRTGASFIVGNNMGALGVGDWNGDGKADLIYTFSGSSSVTFSGQRLPYTDVAFVPGNGDGTFVAPRGYAALANTPGEPAPLLVGDWTGDGNADLVVANVPSVQLGTLGGVVENGLSSSIEVGNGDGTVQSGGQLGLGELAYFGFLPPANAKPVQTLIAGDFNGDGKMDLAAGGIGESTHAPVTMIILGNGQGAFQPPVSYPGIAMASGDFNGDGVIDLVTTAGFLYGNGDGTFRQGPALSDGTPLLVTDFNGDGIADILVANSAGRFTLLLSANPASVPAGLMATGGTPQSAQVNASFPNALQVTVTNASGSPVAGVAVAFTAPPSSGASALLSSSTATTNASGVASVTATANNVSGSYVVTASVNGLSTTFSLTNLIGGSSNLALGKTATQSSTYPGFASAGPLSAVDGNINGNFGNGSVTATNADPNAWWEVDLGASATINSITIWNRTDCCGDRLSDYWVFVSNTPFLATDTPATLQNRAGTFASHQTSAPNPSTTIAAAAPGRYLRIQLSSANYLSLAEVQVFGTGVPSVSNLSQGKAATQSSTLPGASTGGAAAAVDGNLDGSFFDGSVTATNLDPNPWWQVDLGASASVSSIVIWNRTDCCGSRLSDYWVFVSDTPFLATDTPATLQNRAGTFASHQTTAPNPSTTIPQVPACLNLVLPCLPPVPLIQGRYVRVQLSNANYLSLAEVQVFGTGGTPPPADLAQGKAATQSSTLPGAPTAVAASAVDGNLDGNFFDNSVTATNLDPNPWWQVDLGASAAVSSVVIFNRTDCCGTRLSDYWVFVSDTPFLATDTPATLQNRAGTFASHQTTAPNPSTTILAGAQGRYVRVQLSGANYLSLAEVQVFGQ